MKLKQNVFDLIKWDVVRAKREIMLDNLDYLKRCFERQRQFKVHFQLVALVKRLMEIFKETKIRRREQITRLFHMTMMSRKFKRFMKKMGPTPESRLRAQVH